MRKWLIILFLLAAALGIVVWRLPAGLLLDPAQSRLPGMNWTEASGTAWNGRIEGFVWRDLALGTVEWTFAGVDDLESRQTRWDVHGHSPQYEIHARVTLTPDGDVRKLQDVRGHLPAAWIDITDKLPLIYLEGTIELDLQHLHLDRHLPVDGAGSMTWTQAAVTGGASESFGTLKLLLDPAADGADEGIDFRLRSLEPADIHLKGEGTLLRNVYDMDLSVDIAEEREDLIGFMQQVGGEITPGRYRYRWQGNLR